MPTLALAGEKDGDTTRATLVRFIRASEGGPKLRAPAIDDRGFVVDASPGAFSPARGPTVGLTIGAPEIRVRLVRDGLPANLKLYCTLRPEGPAGAPLKMTSPLEGQALHEPGAGHLADHVYLRSPPFAEPPGGGPDEEDDARAQDEAENEHRVVVALMATKARLEEALARKARQENRRRKTTPAPGESALQALERTLAELPPGSDYRVRMTRELRNAKLEIDEVLEGFDDQGQPLDVHAVAEASGPDPTRAAELRKALRQRRAAARQGATYVVEVRLGAPAGPIIAELGVALLPPLEVEVQPYVVSMGGTSQPGRRGLDRLHLEFAATLPDAPKAKPHKRSKAANKPRPAEPAFDFTTLLVTLARLNVIYAPVGVRFWTRASNVKCFRFADAADSPDDPDDAIDDPHQWNVYLPGFNAFFRAGGLNVAKLHFGYHEVPGAPGTFAWRTRNDPWVNLLMNAHARDGQHVHRLNVWFVRNLLGLDTPGDFMAFGFGRLAQTQPAETIHASNGEQPAVELQLGHDQVGVVCAVSPLRAAADPWDGVLRFARTLAHEIGHVAGLTHYLGGEIDGTPWYALNDVWGGRSLMYNAASNFLGIDVGYDSSRTGAHEHDAGSLLGLKRFPPLTIPAPSKPPKPQAAPERLRGKHRAGVEPADRQTAPTERANVIATAQEVALVRATFEGGVYFGDGA